MDNSKKIRNETTNKLKKLELIQKINIAIEDNGEYEKGALTKINAKPFYNRLIKIIDEFFEKEGKNNEW